MPTAPEHRADPFDWAERAQRHFGRFAQDALVILLLALGAMTILALFDLTEGMLLGLWATVLWRWLGWGSLAVAASFVAGAVYLLWRKKHPQASLSWGRVIALEMALFSALALLAVFSQMTIQHAPRYGGYLGWALAELLSRLMGDLWRNILLFGGLLFFSAWGFNFLPHLENFLWRLAGEAPPSQPDASPETESDPLLHPLPEPPTPKPAPAKKAPPPLPPEFRKNFKVEEKKVEKPATPQPRGERLPPLNLLLGEQNNRPDERHINQTAGLLEKTLSEFAIPAKVVGFRIGPTVTQFAVQPGFIKKPGTNEDDPQLMKVRVAQIAALQKDLALALSAERLRIEAPVPGRSYVGVEVPNQRSSVVRMRPILESEAFAKVTAPLAIAIGRDVSGQPLIADLARMPHMLVAGQTGAGKSICIAALATCLAMNNAPEDLRLVMIDAKMVELLRFNGLPHLLGKVETNVERILGVLRWLVAEMEHRYRLLEVAHVRDLESYNRKAKTRLPRLVVILDELADLMMSAPEQTEHHLVRLAQMARATGIHLVVATQRPSTDVVTGLIKANFPARLAFAVASGIDSRVILDTPGAESLLGRGDLLFLNPEVGSPTRAQGVLVTDQEIERMIAFWQKMSPQGAPTPPPWESILTEPQEGGEDALLEQAIEVVRASQRASVSLLQRRLKIGYPRAARLLDQLEEMGVVGEAQGGGRDREVLLDKESDEELG